MVAGLIAYRSAKTTEQAQQKADQLITELENAGARAPSQEAIVRLLGDDGGAVCADPNGALSRATLLAQLSNGASGPGSRPVIANSRVVQGELMIIKVYCPDELEEFQKFVDGLNLDTTGGG
jgi:Tfp pilus assembly protein FimT